MIEVPLASTTGLSHAVDDAAAGTDDRVVGLNSRLAPLGRVTATKRAAEYSFWLSRLAKERRFRNDHYEFFFTELFGIDRSFYAGKRLLDIGCGPRGSLEWAADASERVGLDPLAQAYRSLGTARHSMRYVGAPAERMPFAAGSFDVVSCMNALDHVEDVDRVIEEMTRVAAEAATLLLVVDVNHAATRTEPHTFDWSLTDRFTTWDELWRGEFERTRNGMLGSLRDGLPYDHTQARPRAGLLAARLVRR